MDHPVITLLTDFGTRDHYVASMKGVILGINPRCTIIDISHQVTPHGISEGAFTLANACAYFPKRTIHLAVVDPGVGSARNPILFVTSSYYFLGPDNGLFTLAIRKEKVKQAIVLSNPQFFLPRVSSTFHGRDIFAPVAAHLSLGINPKAFGKKADSWVELDFGKPILKKGRWVGEIIHIDGFGNLISNITERELLNFGIDQSLVIRTGGATIRGLKRGYWEGQRSEPIALLGSGGFLEISVKGASAREKLKIRKGDRISVGVN